MKVFTIIFGIYLTTSILASCVHGVSDSEEDDDFSESDGNVEGMFFRNIIRFLKNIFLTQILIASIFAF